MDTNVKLFGKEPALVGAFLTAVLALLLGLGVVPGLTPETVGLVTAAGAALFGAYAAFAIKQNLLPAIVAAFQALVAVGVGFGLDFLTPELTGLLTGLLVTALGLFLRTQADPKAGSPADPAPVGSTSSNTFNNTYESSGVVAERVANALADQERTVYSGRAEDDSTKYDYPSRNIES